MALVIVLGGCWHGMHKARPDGICAVADDMRHHFYYKRAVVQGSLFVLQRSGYEGAWRYTFRVPTEFMQPLVCEWEVPAGKGRASDTFEQYVRRLAELLACGRIIEQRRVSDAGVDCTDVTILAPTGWVGGARDALGEIVEEVDPLSLDEDRGSIGVVIRHEVLLKKSGDDSYP